VAYIPHTIRKTLSRITDKLLLLWRAVRNEGNIAVFLSLIVYRCIPDPLLCHVDNWRISHILTGAGNWSETEGSADGVWNQMSQYIDTIGISSVVVSCRCVYRVLLAKHEGKGPLENQAYMWNLRNLQAVGFEGLDWIELAPDRDKWRALVNAVMNNGFYKIRRIFWPAANRLVNVEGLNSMQSVRKYMFKVTEQQVHVCYIAVLSLFYCLRKGVMIAW